MGAVPTNLVSLAFAIEDTPGVYGSNPFFLAEPNGDIQFGDEIITVARDPISKLNQPRKGAVVDKNSSVSYPFDFTRDVSLHLMPILVKSRGVNSGLRYRAADVTSTGYTIPALPADEADKINARSLFYGRGYGLSGNNGLKQLNADPVSTDTELTTGGLSAETAPVNADLAIAGYRFAAAEVELTISGNSATLVATTVGFHWGDPGSGTFGLRLQPGQLIHWGGLTSTNQATAGGFGYATVVSISADGLTLTVNRLSKGITGNGGGAGETNEIDILYGDFMRKVAVDDADFLNQTLHFEAAYPNLTVGAETNGYEYSIGNYFDSLTINLNGQDKITAQANFVSLNTNDFVGPTGRIGAAAAAILPIQTSAFNTSSDLGRIRIDNLDGDGLTSFFTQLAVTIANGHGREKTLGCLGTTFINDGTFTPTFDGTIIFTDSAVIDAIRNNETVSYDTIMRDGDGVVGILMPALTLGNGAKQFQKNESVKVSLTGAGHIDDTLQTSLCVSHIPVAPAHPSLCP